MRSVQPGNLLGYRDWHIEEKLILEELRKMAVPIDGARVFDTGATRNSDHGKLVYDEFLSPIVLERYAEFMHSHRIQEDGTLRTGNNWKRGIPVPVYMSSLWRHFMDVWLITDGHQIRDRVTGLDVSLEEALCAVLFNTMGYLHEVLTAQLSPPKEPAVELPPPPPLPLEGWKNIDVESPTIKERLKKLFDWPSLTTPQKEEETTTLVA